MRRLIVNCTSLIVNCAVLLSVINYQFPIAYAQNADFSYSFVVNDNEAADGDILVSGENGLTRANTTAANKLFGIMQANPLIVLKSGGENSKPVATSGTALVNVTTLGGNIKIGDYITSSTIPGKGQKLPGSGYVIGVAQDNFDGSGADKITVDGHQVASGKIPVAVKIDYAETTNPKNINRFVSSLNNAFLNNIQTTEQFFQVVRYAAAGVIIFSSLMFGFFTFSRSVPKGVEAIGRNPLAKNSIYISIVMNIVFTILTVGVGIIASVIILKL